ncbi:hypothetical protein TBLA_0G02980 [Henningerozyma blattae CBS 6284]|uniref:Very long-chain fatty acid transport protein n=1 Tax=Henningerozyma blattae (strain ATCC 34711 / CBS 6284 / DSM 70876 / NBRC 10599 / NRRL Y-10934 / UCD 77-7) TaxID=1071380 RepID=I2H783_HENB6|nr:hypothetical protein TBLA_0G02980 [Tetrapisispora blattae CBS 6284]CCH62235.1 hypothetical protein TBLA_0G02980 [Tetrapisispora blattae CBS 6284]
MVPLPLQRTMKRLVRLIFSPIIFLFQFLLSAPIDALDNRYRIKEDFYIVPFFFKALFRYIWSIRQNKFHCWYVFERNVKNQPNNLFIKYVNSNTNVLQTFTYKETYDIVLRLSYHFVEYYNIQPGDHIAVDCTNKPLFLFIWLSLWNIGAIPAFLNYNSKGQPLVHSLKISNIKQAFIEPDARQSFVETEPQIRRELPDLPIHYIDEHSWEQEILLNNEAKGLLQEHDKRCPKGLTDFKPAMFIYTSGTTGLPKAAIMSWRKANIGTELFAHVFHMNSESIVFTAMPLFHSTAALLGVCAVLAKGSCIAMSPKFSASKFWEQVYQINATHIQYVGEICRYLLNSPISEYEQMHSVKIAMGNGLRPDIWREFKARFNIPIIGEFYAATEAPFATTNYQKADFGVGACRNYGSFIQWFLAFQQTLVKMDPEDDTIVYRNSKGLCEHPKVGEPGEMLMRIFFPRKPETSFQGYLGNKKETESKVIRDVFRKGDAWYRCGDLVREDSNGLWYFMDRMGDTFRWKSENVSTTEVEDQIIGSNPKDFAQVVVVGIKVPTYEGRAGFALIKLDKDKPVDQIPNDKKIQALNNMLAEISGELPKYAMPLFVKFVDEFKMTESHKIRKKIYRDQILPHGEDGKDTLFYLSNFKEYKVLTDDVWQDIQLQRIKL